ncbi:NAD-dependent epimerase/dehydratase family protein [Bremerella cremea]|uniref:HpnA protein n=1 Tax=Blastopirellula marina TaxID=124 RepID=A0A2S8FJ56_9BACT|nr:MULTISPECIES: NAD-dependent epimerase/dehydratase family protein [Pirellulaceae]PQO32197.1 HpnA protein [Blastopirellula marina]RCS45263.1 NAD-dependent epimerase/dehydratase family protein [Bremerella cremea]
MRVLVTGATGFVGNNVVRMLLQQGKKVRVMVRDPRADKSLAGLDIEVVQGDIKDEDNVRTAAMGADAIIHSAAMVHIGWTKEKAMRQTNVEGTRIVGLAALKHNIRLVHVSSVDALGVGQEDAPANEETPREGKTPCPYVVTKREAEEELQKLVAEGLNAVIVNPGLMFGPWDWKPSSGRMLISVIKKQPPLAPSGGGTTCDVRDVAQACINAIEQGRVGENYILGGENLSYFDLWTRIANLTGRRPPWRKLGPYIAGAVGYLSDTWATMEGKEGEVNSAAIKMGSLFHFYSSNKAKAELGYKNRPLDQTIEDAWQWFRKQGYLPA